MRRALFGGSFDPFHNGHLAMIRATLARGLADEVAVVPAALNPHKELLPAPPEHRLRMAELGVAGESGVVVLDLEASRPGRSFTVETLEIMARRHPGDALRLMLGADNLPEFHRWRRPQRVLELADLLVFPRGSGPVAIPSALADRVEIVQGFACPVSSTTVRAELATRGRPVGMVPAAVLAYLVTHRLYEGARGGDSSPAGGGEEAPCP